MSYTISVLAGAFALAFVGQCARVVCLENELRHAHRQLDELEAISIVALAQRDNARSTIAKQAAELETVYEYNHDLENRLLYQQGDSMRENLTYIEWLQWAGSIGLGDGAQ